jgi:hypothetical protein
MTGGSGPDQVLSGNAYKVLALQVELCSPRLIASRATARWWPSGCRPGFWPQGQSNQSTPLIRFPRSLSVPSNLLARRRPKGRRVVPMAGLMAKIRKWLGLGKKS